MGCVSSKLLKKTLKQQVLFSNSDLPNHVVSLTSTTYGALQLDQDPFFLPKTTCNSNTPTLLHQLVDMKSKCDDISVSKPEVINTWELMSDLEDDKEIHIPSSNKEISRRSPFKRLTNHVASPIGVRKLGGKENKGGGGGGGDHINNQCYTTPKGRVFKPWKLSTNSNDKLRKGASLESPRRSSISGVSSSSSSRRRRSLGPLFDPELIDSFEKELSQQQQQQEEEEEHIKKMVSPPMKPRYDYSTSMILSKYEEKCPAGGEHCVVIYTTTLRGIRKTFEDCNVVRSVIESYHIRLIERDISMDSGFKEELRKLMGKKEVKVPLVFVKGRLIGGADQVLKLDDEGKWEAMLQGISKAVSSGCQGCGGIRFVMCTYCNGSCKVLDQHHKITVRCGECNENGLIQCPFCSCPT